MTETEILTIAVQAQESAKAAHHRLDRMNGSIDRLTSQVAEANALGQEILRRLDRQDGLDEGSETAKRGFLDSRWRVITLAVMFVGSATFTTIFTLIARRHG